MLAALVASTIVDIGFLVVLVGLAVAIVMVARVGSFVRAHIPGMQLEIGQVNKAVNHVSPGEPKLIDQVRIIAKDQKELKDEFGAHIKDAAEHRGIEREEFRKINEKIEQESEKLEIVMTHVGKLHEIVAERQGPWDGTERRKSSTLESWAGVERRLAEVSS